MVYGGRMTRNTIIRIAVGLALVAMLTLLVAFNALLVWVATGPRSLERFTPYIESALTGNSDVKAKIGESWLIWDGWQHPLDIRLVNVSLLTKEGVVFSSFPQISLGVDVLSLPFGQVLPTSLSVEKPIISIHQNEDKSLGLRKAGAQDDIQSSTDTISALISALTDPHHDGSLRKLHSLELLHADVTVGNDKDGVVIAAPDTTFIVRKESRHEVAIIINTSIEYGEYESSINGKFAYNKTNRRLEGIMEVGKAQPAVLAGILSNDDTLKALQFPVSGKIGFAFNKDGALDALKFIVEGGRGKIVHDKIDGKLPISGLKVTGSADSGLSRITIESAQADLGGAKFSGSGTVLMGEKGTGITGNVSLTNVDTSQARIYWPLGLAPMSREWVITNIHDGKIPRAEAAIAIKQGDLALPYLPKEDIDATIELRDAKIKYMEGHPEIRNVDAQIKVDGVSLDAAVAAASGFTDTKLSNGRVLIEDLRPDNPLIEVSLSADAPAADIATLLGLPKLEHAKHLNLDAKKATGRATGDAKLGFYFFEKDANGKDMPLTYAISAKLNNVGTPGFLDRFDIENASGDMTIDEKAITYNGSAKLNGADISAGKLTYSLAPEGDVDTTFEATASLDEESLARFGIRLPVSVRQMNGVAVAADLSTHKDTTSIPKFSLKGEGVDISGNAKLTEDGKDIASLKLGPLQYDKTSLESLEYQAIPGGYRLAMKGKSLDVSSMFEKKGEGFSFEKFPAMDLDLDVGMLYAGFGQPVSNAKGKLTCSATRCGTANISGRMNDKDMHFSIMAEGKNRRLNAASGDAGAMVKALGITDSMEGGELALTGQFEDNAAGGGALRGKLLIKEYTLKKAPTLAKLLSLASLTGFFDTLSGNGIAFKKLEAPFMLKDDVITLKDARAFGAAMGMTADGTITFPHGDLALEGTIVPSYTLNNVVGKVPLVGNLLMGGEGQGVFAARYTMKGDSDDPDVAVNPLSILTPGFLRNLFDVF